MKLPEIKTESAPGTLAGTNLNLIFEHDSIATAKTRPLYIPQLIEIKADARDVEKYHRGLYYTITVDQGEGMQSYHVVCQSRYKLKNGQVRLKFLTTEPPPPPKK